MAVTSSAGRGEFATARKGGLTTEEIRQIEAHRAKARPTPWSALARRYGRCETDIRIALRRLSEPVACRPAAPVTTRGDERRSLAPVALWTEAEDRLLVALFIDANWTATEVAKSLGRTPLGVASRAKRLGYRKAAAA